MAYMVRIKHLQRLKGKLGSQKPSADQLSDMAREAEIDVREMIRAKAALTEQRSQETATGAGAGAGDTEQQGPGSSGAGVRLPPHASNFDAVANMIGTADSTTASDETPNPEDKLVEPTRALTNLIIIPTQFKKSSRVLSSFPTARVSDNVPAEDYDGGVQVDRDRLSSNKTKVAETRV